MKCILFVKQIEIWNSVFTLSWNKFIKETSESIHTMFWTDDLKTLNKLCSAANMVILSRHIVEHLSDCVKASSVIILNSWGQQCSNNWSTDNWLKLVHRKWWFARSFIHVSYDMSVFETQTECIPKVIIIVVIITCFQNYTFEWAVNCDVTSIHS